MKASSAKSMLQLTIASSFDEATLPADVVGIIIYGIICDKTPALDFIGCNETSE